MVIRDTVANVDASDSRCRCIGKIIARDLRLVAGRLYRMAITRPLVTCGRYSCGESIASSQVRGSSMDVVACATAVCRLLLAVC
jgi:hypothetical protein